MSRQITIYTDGSANNGTHDKGGYGIVFINGTVKQYAGGSYYNTSSARMEVKGVVEALKKCKIGDNVTIFCDNEYAVNSLDKGWVFKWALEGWKEKGRTRKNADLWKQFLVEYNRLERKVKMRWVRGHAKIEDHNYYNHVADILASRGANRETKIKDLNL